MRRYLWIIPLLASLHGFPQQHGQGLIDSLTTLLTTTQKGQTKERALTLNSLGKAYLNLSDYIHSQRYFSDCLMIAEKLDDKMLMAACYRNIGVLQFHEHDYDKADESDRKALTIFEATHNLPGKASLLKAMADDYLQRGDSVNATRYYNLALPLFKQQGDKQSEATVYSNQSILCNTDYQKKIELGLLAKSIWDHDKTENELPAVNIGNLGVAYLDIVRYDSLHRTKPSLLIPSGRGELLKIAEKYLTLAIDMSHATNDPENYSYYTGVLAELQEQKGDYRNAYYNFRKYQNVADSIFSQENKNKIAAIESQRTIDVKNTEIENKVLLIANQHKKMWLLVICMAFLVIIGVFIYRQSLIRKRTNTTLLRLNNELDEANKVKSKFLGILSHDLRSPVANLINFMELQKRKPGVLTEAQINAREDRITGSARSLLETMDTMLLWSKGQMEYFKPTLSPVAVKDLFAYLEKMFAGADPIRFNYSCTDELVIFTDENYLRVIMHNLTANAIKALQETPAGMITWAGWQDRENFYLSITDNGPGVRDEQLRALYDETAGSSARQGLGLHIIRDLAKAIGVTVTFIPQEASGTSFVLRWQSSINVTAASTDDAGF